VQRRSFRKACKGKNPDGCARRCTRSFALGRAGGPTRRLRCRARSRCARTPGSRRRLRQLGGTVRPQARSPQHLSRSESLLSRACDKGSARALPRTWPRSRSHSGDKQRAEQLGQRAWQLGDPAGCAHLGDLYLTPPTIPSAPGVYYLRAAREARRRLRRAGYVLAEQRGGPEARLELLQWPARVGHEILDAMAGPQ